MTKNKPINTVKVGYITIPLENIDYVHEGDGTAYARPYIVLRSGKRIDIGTNYSDLEKLFEALREQVKQPLPTINGLDCPACGHPTLFLGEGGYITCGLEDCPNPDYAESQAAKHERELAAARDKIRDEIERLNWIKILDSAIKSRPTSWREDPVFEYRNASDEVKWAIMRACYGAGIFNDPWEQAAESVAATPPNQDHSDCHQATVTIGGDGNEGTHYYVCSKCNEPCDLYVANQEQAWLDELIASYIIIEVKDPLYVKEAKMQARRNFKATINQRFDEAVGEHVAHTPHTPDCYAHDVRNELKARQRQAWYTAR